jgi:hypothetical protein
LRYAIHENHTGAWVARIAKTNGILPFEFFDALTEARRHGVQINFILGTIPSPHEPGVMIRTHVIDPTRPRLNELDNTVYFSMDDTRPNPVQFEILTGGCCLFVLNILLDRTTRDDATWLEKKWAPLVLRDALLLHCYFFAPYGPFPAIFKEIYTRMDVDEKHWWEDDLQADETKRKQPVVLDLLHRKFHKIFSEKVNLDLFDDGDFAYYKQFATLLAITLRTMVRTLVLKCIHNDTPDLLILTIALCKRHFWGIFLLGIEESLPSDVFGLGHALKAIEDSGKWIKKAQQFIESNMEREPRFGLVFKK